ncbi:MAG: hypothetical protein U9R50_05890 [Campylobacterota bacterium]|nr:hypothetical protein [Campylobacterota bacterium]
MQRSLSHKISINPIIVLPLFLLYESLSSIYLLLPPLLGLIFYLFVDARESNNIKSLFIVVVMLIIYEAEKGYLFLSTLFYFTLLYQFLLPYLKQNIICKSCLKFIFISLVYLGYYLLILLVSHVFLLEVPMIDLHVIYYILIEFLIVSLL